MIDARGKEIERTKTWIRNYFTAFRENFVGHLDFVQKYNRSKEGKENKTCEIKNYKTSTDILERGL